MVNLVALLLVGKEAARQRLRVLTPACFPEGTTATFGTSEKFQDVAADHHLLEFKITSDASEAGQESPPLPDHSQQLQDCLNDFMQTLEEASIEQGVELLLDK